MLAYRKRPERPNLVLTRSWVDPHTASPAVGVFRALAFQAAVVKARELGGLCRGYPVVAASMFHPLIVIC